MVSQHIPEAGVFLPGIQERHLKYEWDGTKVGRYFDFKDGIWVSLV